MDFEKDFAKLTFEDGISPDISTMRILQEAIFVLITIISLVLNVIMIYTILRYRMLRDGAHYILVNWALADSLALLANPSIYRLIAVVGHIWIRIKVMHIILQFQLVVYITVVFFMVLLLVDWCIASYFDKSLERFRLYTKYYISFIWGIAILQFVIVICLYLKKNYVDGFQWIILFGTFSLLTLFSIIIESKELVNRCDGTASSTHSHVMLKIVKMFLSCWAFGYTSLVVRLVTSVKIGATEELARCFIYGSSILIFVIMYRLNKNFNACLKQICKRSGYGELEPAMEQEVTDMTVNDNA